MAPYLLKGLTLGFKALLQKFFRFVAIQIYLKVTCFSP